MIACRVIDISQTVVFLIEDEEEKTSERSTEPKKSSPAQDAISEYFQEATDFFPEKLHNLALEATAYLEKLMNLEERLVTIYSIMHREQSAITAERDELLSSLFAFLGWNSKKINALGRDQSVLADVLDYRGEALDHVQRTLVTLERMEEDMKDLKTRVVAPRIVGSKLPASVHIRNIQKAIERLYNAQRESRKLV